MHTLDYFIKCIIAFIPCMEIFLIFVYIFIYCRRGNNHFDVNFRRIGPYFFLSKDGKDAVREGRNGRKGVYFPPESASFPLINNMLKSTFPYLYLDLACKQLSLPPRKGLNRRNESTIIFKKYCDFGVLWLSLKSSSLTVWTIETLTLRLRGDFN